MDQKIVDNHTPHERLKHLIIPLFKKWLIVFSMLITLSAAWAGGQFVITVYEPFEKRIEYFGVYPDVPVVALGSVARFWSDSEIKQPVTMRWVERIECDYAPYDNYIEYQHYVNLEVIQITYEEPKPRPNQDIQQPPSWLANNRATGSPAKYEFESNCRLVSNACQILKFGYKKCQQLRSEPVHIRYIPFVETRENH